MSNGPVRILFVGFLLIGVASCNSCNPFTNKPNVSGIDVSLTVLRLEQDYNGLARNYDSTFNAMSQRYGDFLPFYLKMVAQVVSPRDTAIQPDTFVNYVNDPYITMLRDTAFKKFNDFNPFQEDLTKAFRYFKYYFPDSVLPTVVTFVDGPPYGFTYAYSPTEKYLAIGLDGYFGSRFPAYTLRPEPIPAYLLRRFRPEYLVPNTVNAWVSGLTDFEMQGHKLLDAMVYKGKSLYLAKKLLPDTPDSLIFGYDKASLEWLDANEHEVWRFFITNNLLFENDPLVFSKYVNDAPGTSGMPAEAPGNIGSWVGYRIVNAYMKRNEKLPLEALLKDPDAQGILTQSRYKP